MSRQSGSLSRSKGPRQLSVPASRPSPRSTSSTFSNIVLLITQPKSSIKADMGSRLVICYFHGQQSGGSSMPKFVGGELRAVHQCLQLRPHDRRMDALHIRTLGAAAIRAGDDVLAADQRCEADDALGDKLRMLDHVGGMADHARDERLIGR